MTVRVLNWHCTIKVKYKLSLFSCPVVLVSLMKLIKVDSVLLAMYKVKAKCLIIGTRWLCNDFWLNSVVLPSDVHEMELSHRKKDEKRTFSKSEVSLVGTFLISDNF